MLYVSEIMLAAFRARDTVILYEAHELFIAPAIAGAFKDYALLSAKILYDYIGAETFVAVTALHKGIRKASQVP
jgi:hypothetical protein